MEVSFRSGERKELDLPPTPNAKIMRQAILNFPQQFKTGLKAAQEVEVQKEVDKIVICGMGGSALPANLLITYLPQLEIPVYIPRNYDLPPTDQNTLVICISYSGNTEETISCFNQALQKDLQPIAITTDGELKRLAEQEDLPMAEIPSGIQPRQATGYLFSALLKVLGNCEVISDPDSDLTEAAQSLKPESLEPRGKSIARNLVNKIPIIYASERYKTLARIWKIKFNENSKSMAFWNYFPELNHNEMVGYENMNQQISSDKLQLLMLKDEQDSPEILKRMRLTQDLLEERGINTEVIDIEGNSRLEKIFNNLILSDWATYHLANQYGIDPEPVEMVEDFKDKL